MIRLLAVIDAISRVLAAVAMVSFLVLVGDMMYEVVSRRGFNAPTLWAYDIAFMMNGALFLLAAGYTLLVNEHIRIDFLSSRLPPRVQDAINLAVYLLLLLPMLGFACYGTVDAAWHAFATGEIEPSSTWKPVVWPFYTGIAIGFCGLSLQAVAQCVRHGRAMLGSGPSPLASRSEGA